ncbi:MAG: SIR2 family protein [Rhodospirillaceae bacterium]|nr:SIR2 family protein [Rhodospirillaceae bacterium]
MRFLANGPIIPDALLMERDAGRVVFFCGAGVSIPAGKPDFSKLTQHVIDKLTPSRNSEIIKAFDPWVAEPSDTPPSARIPLDQIFQMLQQEYGQYLVARHVAECLALSDGSAGNVDAHDIILRISANQAHEPQVVTTNYDHLFEHAPSWKDYPKYDPPGLPDIQYGSSIKGITYLHGRLAEEPDQKHNYILSSGDFGRAYLAQGWATTFVRHLLQKYTVVLVGYQAEDPPIRYLLQGLNSGVKGSPNRLYAFDKGQPDEIEAKWQDRGVIPLAYQNEHSVLWDTLGKWAQQSDNPATWRSSVISMAQKSPRDLPPHERGMVCHLVRSEEGARLFAKANPIPSAEWLCVFDCACRCAAPPSNYEESEIFDPLEAYGLDDDSPRSSSESTSPKTMEETRSSPPDDLIAWRQGDTSPDHRLRLSNGGVPMPNRLSHLTNWVVCNIGDPVLA